MSTSDDAQITRYIRAELAARGMNQQSLARHVGMASSSMSRYLHDERMMSVKTIGSIAEAFNMSLGEFLSKASDSRRG